MEQSLPPDPEIARGLTTLGVASRCQWDVLVFLYQHHITLLRAEDLARLLGYTRNAILVALDALSAQNLVARSRVAQGAQLYQCRVPLNSPRSAAFAQLRTRASASRGGVRQQMRQRYFLVVCAWCTKLLRWQSMKDTVSLYETSHGICPTCLEKVSSTLEMARPIIPLRAPVVLEQKNPF
jgi:hypothetical protein